MLLRLEGNKGLVIRGEEDCVVKLTATITLNNKVSLKTLF